MRPVIYADLRCLQDHNYRVRGIGRHVAALFRTRCQSAFSNCRTIGLTDPLWPVLPAELASLVDEVSCSANPVCASAPAIFIDGTPMTHDTRFNLRFLNHPAFLTAAVVYDFIPLDSPGYLRSVADRVGYVAKIARLRQFDRFFPISEYTACRLSELAGISRHRMNNTGASVQRTFYELRNRFTGGPSCYDAPKPYFLVVSGGDVRKNAEVAVKAVRHLNRACPRRIALKVAGHYDDACKRRLLALAGHRENAGFLEFYPGVAEDELVRLYSGAIATIAPSHIEGFSLPVVEASVCGSPVIASMCPAHMELIEQEQALFPSYDAGGLYQKLNALLNDPVLRDSLVASQAHLGAKFHEDAVGRRFWSTIEAAVQKRAGSQVVTKKAKPRIAFLSPYPPDQSDSAQYTAGVMRAGAKLFESHLYTGARRPLAFGGVFRDAGGISLAPLISEDYEAIVSVLGNDPVHSPVLNVFERCGGPCILHDIPLTSIYVHRLGQDGFLRFAEKLLGRSVLIEEVKMWLQARNLPSLFLEPMVQRASPLIVHSPIQQAEIRKRYGVDAQVLPCCPATSFTREELAPHAIQAARARRGIAPGAFAICSFGDIAQAMRVHVCIAAIDLLRAWGIPAEFFIVGSANVAKSDAHRLAAQYGVGRHVHYDTGFVSYSVRRDFLIGADAAIQLRPGAIGHPSMDLADCITAALPSVATNDLAVSCAAPAYVSTVPDRYSALQVAEQLARIWEARVARHSYMEERAEYVQRHNFKRYAEQLVEILGIA